jgi:hypothetical protein
MGITLNFNNCMYMAAVFLDIGKAFDTTWHLGLLCNLSKLQISIRGGLDSLEVTMSSQCY